MFYQIGNYPHSYHYDTLASIAAKSLGKRIGKVTTQQMDSAGTLNFIL